MMSAVFLYDETLILIQPSRYPLMTCGAIFALLVGLAYWVRPVPQVAPVIVKLPTPASAIEVHAIEPIRLPELELTFQKNSLPDFTQYPLGEKRKRAFSSYLVPLVQQINEHQIEIRSAALTLIAQPKVSKKESLWLQQVCQLYRIQVACKPGKSLKSAIELHIDAVPVALAIAQGAKESGWGTSRFAREGNNLFGHWCFQEGCGLVPKNRLEEASHEVAVFPSPKAAVAAYIRNLNSHQAYVKLRVHRLQNSDAELAVQLHALTQGLQEYSERGESYVTELQTLIRRNNSWLSYPAISVQATP